MPRQILSPSPRNDYNICHRRPIKSANRRVSFVLFLACCFSFQSFASAVTAARVNRKSKSQSNVAPWSPAEKDRRGRFGQRLTKRQQQPSIAPFALAIHIRGGSDTPPDSPQSPPPPPATSIPPPQTAATMVESDASNTTITASKWTWQDARRTLFPIYGEKEVCKFLLIGSIKFFIILALTLTRDTKDTLVVTQCGAEAIAFLKVRSAGMQSSSA